MCFRNEESLTNYVVKEMTLDTYNIVY